MHIDPEPSKEQYRIRQVQTSYPGPGTDGLLTASKIATLKLNAPTPESQVRIRLPAGGKWIRTIGPARGAHKRFAIGADRDPSSGRGSVKHVNGLFAAAN